MGAAFWPWGNMFKSPSVTPPAQPPAAIPPTLADPSVKQASQTQQERAAKAAGAGFADTVKNKGGAQGVSLGAGDLAGKSLLG